MWRGGEDGRRDAAFHSASSARRATVRGGEGGGESVLPAGLTRLPAISGRVRAVSCLRPPPWLGTGQEGEAGGSRRNLACNGSSSNIRVVTTVLGIISSSSGGTGCASRTLCTRRRLEHRAWCRARTCVCRVPPSAVPEDVPPGREGQELLNVVAVRDGKAQNG